MSGTPAVSAGYSLAAMCGSEMIGTCFMIFLGESIIANELLPKTKGARMGWLAVAFGFGLSFGVVIMMFGYISAHLNPATCLALWVIGKIPFTHFLALSGAEFAGALLGACLVWLHFLPHFKSVPEPPVSTADELLLRSRDALSPEALMIASYDTREQDRMRGGVKANLLGQAVKDIKFYFAEAPVAPEDHRQLVEVALGPDELKSGAAAVAGGLRRRSVQVCDVHRRLKDMSIEEFRDKLHLTTAPGGGLARSASINLAELDRATTTSATSDAPATSGAAAGPSGEGPGAAAWGSGGGKATEAGESSSGGGGAAARRDDSSEEAGGRARAALAPVATAAKTWRQAYEAHVERFGDKQAALYDAAVVADQNAKLSIFATRPAIYTPVFNFVTELLATVALVFGALMMYARRDLLAGDARDVFRSYEGMWIGFFVFVCILGLGGPTGIAANPARDFSPRLAHALLPIAGKGPSEWHYAWVPFLASFAGGAVAGGLYQAVQLMNHSAV